MSEFGTRYLRGGTHLRVTGIVRWRDRVWWFLTLRWRRAFQRRGPSKPMVVTAVDREAGVITVDAAE